VITPRPGQLVAGTADPIETGGMRGC
jgi:hypothetical protein